MQWTVQTWSSKHIIKQEDKHHAPHFTSQPSGPRCYSTHDLRVQSLRTKGSYIYLISGKLQIVSQISHSADTLNAVCELD